MLEGYNRQLVGLYRARPYTKAIPFNVTVNSAGMFPLWTPQNSFFELNRMYIKSTIANIDFAIVDTNITDICAMVIPSTALYTLVDLGPAGYRSILSSNSVLGIVDPTNAGATVKGVIYGWEVTKEGNYR